MINYEDGNATTITLHELMMLRITPIKTKIRNWFLQRQINHRRYQISFLEARVKNDNDAVRILNKEIINLHNLTD